MNSPFNDSEALLNASDVSKNCWKYPLQNINALSCTITQLGQLASYVNDCVYTHMYTQCTLIQVRDASLVAPVPQVALGTQTQVCMN